MAQMSQQPFPQGGAPATLCNSSQSFSQRQTRKAGNFQCPLPVELLGGSSSLTLSYCPRSPGFMSKAATWVQTVV